MSDLKLKRVGGGNPTASLHQAQVKSENGENQDPDVRQDDGLAGLLPIKKA